MKIPIIIISLVVGMAGVKAQNSTPSQTNVPPPTAYHVVEQDANHNVWQRETYEKAANGKIVKMIHKYTELGTGLNFRGSNDKWQPAKEEIDILPDGTAAAIKGQNQAYFPVDLYNGIVKFVMIDGKQIKSDPIGLSYDDGTNTVLIAILTNSIGQLVSSNQIVYPNAFVGVNADIRFTYRKSGTEQDIIVNSQLPTPESLGLNKSTTKLQVLTEFFDPPLPKQIKGLRNHRDGLVDTTLVFGQTRMGRGKAFIIGNDKDSANRIPVYKNWEQIEGRHILIEQLPYQRVSAALSSLPPVTASVKPSNSGIGKLSKTHLLTPMHLYARSTNNIQMAKAALPSKKSLVLDYVTVNDIAITNMTFQADMTYYISGQVNIQGVTIFSGGAVLKYSDNASSCLNVDYINAPFPIISPTFTAYQGGLYRPVVFTSVDDNTVGEVIGGSTGNPTINSDTYVCYQGGATMPETINNIRVSYAGSGIEDDGGQIAVTDSQFVNCATAVNYSGTPTVLENDLFARCPWIVLQGQGGDVQLINVTVDQASYFIIDAGFDDDSTVEMTNTIFTSVTNMIGIPGIGYSYNAPTTLQNSLIAGTNNNADIVYLSGSSQITNLAGIYQTVGAGNYYLTTNSPYHNVGTTNIDPLLLADLSGKTTWPPLIFSNITISTNLTLGPQAPRDNVGNPDLGYHYDPLDYVFGGVEQSSNLIFNAGTAVGYFYSEWDGPGNGMGIYTESTTTVTTFKGTATMPCVFANASTVQEGGNGNWTVPGSSLGGMTFLTGPTLGAAQLNAWFTHCYQLAAGGNHFADVQYSDLANLNNCEFYDGAIYSTASAYYFTNCLFVRTAFTADSSGADSSWGLENCLFWNGFFMPSRFGSRGTASWFCRNTAFDGTSITVDDEVGDVTNYTSIQNNAYDVGSSQLPYDTNDVTVTNYNWQSSWFGDFYLPSDSPLIDAGSTTANQVGLFHFTTQTNQVPETNSTVDIGYHYVATDAYGNPLDSNGDGIPDYVEDPLGNGLPYGGTNWALAILTQPVSQTALQGNNANFSVTAAGIAPLQFQWYFGSVALTNATNATLTFNNVQTNNAGSYFVTVANGFGSITSSVVALTVETPPSIVITNPVNNAAMAVSLTNVTVAAVASDAWTNIAQVQFIQGTNILGLVTNAPYTLTWSNAPTGNYALTAVAVAGDGLAATSAVVNLTISSMFASNSMVLWLKADAITILTNNTFVGVWPDASGWRHNATQATTNNEPAYVANIISGYPVVRFNGTSSLLTLTNFLTGTTGAEAMVVVKAATNQPTTPGTLWWWGVNSATYYPNASGQISESFGSSALYNLGAPAQSLTQYNLYDVAGTNGSWAAWLDGTLLGESSTNAYGYNTQSPYYLGWNRGSSANYFMGDVAEVLVFNRPLTTVERTAANVYLDGKYGLLPAVPVAPTNLVAQAISTNQISLTWSEPLTNGGTTQILVERSTSSNGTFTVVAQLANALSYVDTNLMMGTTYYYEVQAQNLTTLSPASNEAWATTLTNGVSMPLGNLLLWLKADAGLAQLGTNTPVSYWADKSGHGNDASQVIKTGQPLWEPGVLNGYPVVRFNGTNSLLTLTNFLTGTTGAEAMVVIKVVTNQPTVSETLWWWGVNSATYYPNTSGQINESFGSSSVYNLGAPAQPLTQYDLYDVAGTNGSWGAWLDGTLLYESTTNVYGYNTQSSYYLGYNRNSSANYFMGDVAEVLVFNRPLTTVERMAADAYLNGKYGLLPAVPMAPTNLVAQTISTNQISLTWSEPLTNGGATQIVVERSTSSNGTFTVVAYLANALSYMDTNLLAGTTYYYEVQAQNLTMLSPASNEAWATTLMNGVSMPVGNLILWLKADTGLAQLGTNTPVSYWADQSGHGNDASQVIKTGQPLWEPGVLNGNPVVRFNGTNSLLALTNFLMGTTGAEVMVVVKVATNQPAAPETLWWWGANSATYYPNTSGQINESFGSSALYNLGAPAQSLTQYNLYDAAGTNGSWEAWLDGTLLGESSTNAYGYNTQSPYYLGWNRGSSANYFQGDVSEVLVFNRPLTAYERIAADVYLNGKYGLLPAVPVAPTNLVAQALSTNQISLTWSEPLTNGGTTQILVERSTSSNGTFTVVAQLANALSYVDTNLLGGTTYYYEVQAQNLAVLSPASNEAWATTLTNGVSVPLGNLILWLKADSGLGQLGTNTPVSYWADQSGHGNDASQVIKTGQPLWEPGVLNGNPVVRFNGTNSLLALTNFLMGTTGAEVMVVVKVATNQPTAPETLWWWGANSATYYPNTSGQITESFGSSLVYNLGAPAQPPTQYDLYDVAGTNGGWGAWLDGTLLYESNTNVYGYNVQSPYYLGWNRGSSANYFQGDVSEVLVFNRPLTPYEREVTGNYLMTKYNLFAYANNTNTPIAPITLATIGVASEQLRLQWTSASSNIISFHLERELGAGGYQEISTNGLPAYTTNLMDTTGVATNAYNYRVRAHNYFGDTYSAVISPPTVAVISWPSPILQGVNNSIGATAADAYGSVTNVVFRAGAMVIGSDTSSPYNVVWNPSMQGPFPLTAMAFDSFGNSQYSAAVPVTSYLDSNGDGIPDVFQVQSGNDPLNPWTPNDTGNTPPTIQLVLPINATYLP